MTTIHSDSQLPSADPDMPGYLGADLNRHDDGGDRVMFKEPDRLADYEWPPSNWCSITTKLACVAAP